MIRDSLADQLVPSLFTRVEAQPSNCRTGEPHSMREAYQTSFSEYWLKPPMHIVNLTKNDMLHKGWELWSALTRHNSTLLDKGTRRDTLIDSNHAPSLAKNPRNRFLCSTHKRQATIVYLTKTTRKLWRSFTNVLRLWNHTMWERSSTSGKNQIVQSC